MAMTGRTRRSSLAMVVAFASTSIANYAFSLIMARLLLPGDFGVLAFAQTLLFISGLVLETGVPWSLAKELATVSDNQTRAMLIRGAALTNITLAGAIGLAILLLYGVGPLYTGLESWGVAAAVAFSLPLIALVGVARGMAQGLEAFGKLATLQVTEVVGKAVASTALVLLGFNVLGAVAGFLIGAVLATLVGLGVIARQLEMRMVGPVARSGLKIIGPMFGAFLGSALLLNLDFVALKLFASQERAAAGFYQAAIVLANAPYFLVSSVMVPLVFAQLARRKTLAATADVISQALKLTAVLIIPIELFLMVAPNLVLSLLFPAPYEAGAEALRFRALGVALLILVTVVAAAYQALGRASRVAVIFLSASVVELALLWYLTRFSAVGAATAFAITALIVAVALGGSYLQLLDVGKRRRTLNWSGRYTIALGMSALAFWVMSSLAFTLLPTLAVSYLSYLLLVLALRLVPIQWLRGSLGVGPVPVTRP